jgi:hypothetical protein
MQKKNNFYATLHPPIDCNPTTELWTHLGSNAIIIQKLSKYLKLVEITRVMVLGNVEDK